MTMQQILEKTNKSCNQNKQHALHTSLYFHLSYFYSEEGEFDGMRDLKLMNTIQTYTGAFTS